MRGDDRLFPIHDVRQLTKVMQRAMRSAGVPVIRFHDLRHTFATLALAARVPFKVVSEMLGHKSVKLTLDTYAHTLPGMHESAVEASRRRSKFGSEKRARDAISERAPRETAPRNVSDGHRRRLRAAERSCCRVGLNLWPISTMKFAKGSPSSRARVFMAVRPCILSLRLEART